MDMFRCGLGMSYDPDHQRCDLSKNIECQNGERPSWTPPEGCKKNSMDLLSIIRFVSF